MDEIPEKLLRARRQLDALPEVQLLEDWCHEQSGWFIKVRIKVDKPSGDIPQYSDWYVVVSSNYPSGKVKIYPATENSVIATFPHQSDNTRIASNKLWRTGALCTEVIDNLFASEEYSSDHCLTFHLRRAVMWLDAAATGTLIKHNDPYENPDFSPRLNRYFAFSEDEVSYLQWEDKKEAYGFAYGSFVSQDPSILCVRRFMNYSGQTIHSVDWGTLLTEKPEKESRLLWVKLPLVSDHN